ncbi:MAG: hypothetical protein JXC33_05990 [Deltaproteobacteria bacterium]|nr:hypothetical protein [Deltaproteobacteria bacterium]
MKDSVKPVYERGTAVTTTIIRLLMIFCLAMFLGACAPPGLYSVDLLYISPEKTSLADENVKNLSITVTQFNDMRTVDDKRIIGKVVKSDGMKIPILPKHHMPADAVTRAVKHYLNSKGYHVSNRMPGWNLGDDSIENGWGDIVIGGNIYEFELICLKEMPIRKYMARVKLSVVFADVAKKKIKFTVNVESSPSLEHVRFTEGKMTEVMNDALAAAINRIFENREVHQKIREIAEQKGNSEKK